jgi:hypothetical protein
MLYSMRMQLPKLRGLKFIVYDTENLFQAEDVLTELGRLSQLKQLHLHLQGSQVSKPSRSRSVASENGSARCLNA